MTVIPSSPIPASSAQAGAHPRNRLAIAALVVAIVGLVVTQIPAFIGVFAGGPEDLVALILGIIAIIAAVQKKTGLVPAIIATVIAAAALFGIGFGEGILW